MEKSREAARATAHEYIATVLEGRFGDVPRNLVETIESVVERKTTERPRAIGRHLSRPGRISPRNCAGLSVSLCCGRLRVAARPLIGAFSPRVRSTERPRAIGRHLPRLDRISSRYDAGLIVGGQGRLRSRENGWQAGLRVSGIKVCVPRTPPWAAGRSKDTCFTAQFRRLAGRRGKKRAIIAVAPLNGVPQ